MANKVNYDDKRFQDVNAQKDQALTQNENLYGGMINSSDKYYQDLINANNEWGEKQQELQQQQTDHLLDKIEQNKEFAHQDYLKEQTGAYTDYQKATDQYGVNAENMASSGLSNTGFSESSNVSMYNAYQNRVAVARDGWQRASLNFDNSMKDAMLQNNQLMAKIAFETLQKSLELSLQGFQYKNTLLIEQANKQQQIDQMYYGRYQDVLAQINKEIALEEDTRRYNEKMAEDKRRYEEQKAFQREQFEYQKKQASRSRSGGGGRSYSSGGGGGVSLSGGGGKKYEVNTDYWQGGRNRDVERYGAFANGYQPRGIATHGKVHKTGQTIVLHTETLNGEKRTVTQNIWRADDGTKWYWDGRKNRYVSYR